MSITLSRERFCDSSFSMDRTAKFVNLSSDIVDLKYVLVHLRVEKDCSHSAVLTTMVRTIQIILVKTGKAVFSGRSSTNTSLILSISLPSKAHNVSLHSMDSDSLSNLYISASVVK